MDSRFTDLESKVNALLERLTAMHAERQRLAEELAALTERLDETRRDQAELAASVKTHLANLAAQMAELEELSK